MLMRTNIFGAIILLAIAATLAGLVFGGDWLAHLWKWTTHDATGFYTLLLAMVAISQAGLFLWQLILFRKTLKPAEEAAKSAAISANALIDNERPWVGPVTTYSDPIEGGKPFKPHVVIMNFGNTPALDMRANFKGSIKPSGESPDPPEIANAPGKALFPAVHDWYYPFSTDRIMSQPDYEAIRDGYKVPWIVGRIEYLDNRGRKRHTDVCTRWDGRRQVFVPHDTGNDAT